MARQYGSAQRKDYEEIGARRNPYLVDYERQRGKGTARREVSAAFPGEQGEKPARRIQPPIGAARPQAYERKPARRVQPPMEGVRPQAYGREPARRVQPPRGTASRRAIQKRRKRRVLMHRLFLGAWALCILLFTVYFTHKGSHAAAGDEQKTTVADEAVNNLQTRQLSGDYVQGIPAEKFAEHPQWTEDLLTPNEYSRPGDALEAVNNIFVHYTANPGTSAAQNRSYFEWQKDTHEASVSAHFVIGYEGEIIQCVPLDEIAYAVMTRNYDSISIECCYLEKDGSFTEATYDSLISLLSWLVDAYDLSSEDILRHYDCGGKKCPLYYTEHEDAWEQLKKDVDKL